MRRSFVVVAPVAVVLAIAFCAMRLCAEEEPKSPAAPAALSKEDKVRKLLRLQGGEALAKMTMDKMLDQFKGMPGLPAGFADRFREKVNLKELTEFALPGYVKHLDDATLDAVIAFFETPAGRNLAAQTPAITMETMDASAAWGRRIGAEVARELAAEKK